MKRMAEMKWKGAAAGSRRLGHHVGRGAVVAQRGRRKMPTLQAISCERSVQMKWRRGGKG